MTKIIRKFFWEGTVKRRSITKSNGIWFVSLDKKVVWESRICNCLIIVYFANGGGNWRQKMAYGKD
jgi:hypothetical protein